MKLFMAVIPPFKAAELHVPGRIGDGKIFVVNIAHAVRIRTGETNSAAL